MFKSSHTGVKKVGMEGEREGGREDTRTNFSLSQWRIWDTCSVERKHSDRFRYFFKKSAIIVAPCTGHTASAWRLRGSLEVPTGITGSGCLPSRSCTHTSHGEQGSHQER